jgi:hypothetical protein
MARARPAVKTVSPYLPVACGQTYLTKRPSGPHHASRPGGTVASPKGGARPGFSYMTTPQPAPWPAQDPTSSALPAPYGCRSALAVSGLLSALC